MIEKDENIVLLGSAYTKPEAIETKRSNYIELLTDEGVDYNNFLISLFNGSVTHGAIVSGMAGYIYGNGVIGSDAFNDRDIRKICFDFKLFGKYAMQVVWNKAKTKVVRIKHIPVNLLRKNCDGAGFYYSDDWTKFRQKAYKPILMYPLGHPEKEAPQVYYYQPYVVGNLHYSLPDYNGAISYIELEMEIGNFHNSNIQNGLAPSMLMNFNNGIPDEKTRKTIERKINEKWSGSSNAGKLVVTFNQSKEQAPTLEAAPISDLDKQYQFLTTESAQKILTGHKITSPMLFGIRGESGLGSNAEELTQAWDILQETVVAVFQRQVEYGLNEILTIGNIGGEVKIVPFEPSFKKKEVVTPQPQEQALQTHKNTPELDVFCIDSDEPNENELLRYMEQLPEETEETMQADGFSLMSDEEVEQVGLHELSVKIIKGEPGKPSKIDNEFYRVRYKYSGPNPIQTSREFCTKMIGKYSYRVYRYEDINFMSFRSANGDFGTYSIFKWKGSFNCRHHWKKQVFRKNGYKGRSKIPSAPNESTAVKINPKAS